MQTMALCSLVFAILVPPTQTNKGKQITAPTVTEAGWELQKLPGEKVGVTATPTNNWPAWSDDGKFPLEVNLTWVRQSVTVNKPKLNQFELHLIDCDSVDNAKKYFLVLGIVRHVDYAQSGKYLIKGSPQALDWFTQHYGAVRYTILAEAVVKDKK